MAAATSEAAVFGVAELAARWGLKPWKLRREVELLATSGRQQFRRVAGLWLIAEGQLDALADWLRERGLLRS